MGKDAKECINHLRDEGRTYGEIARAIGCYRFHIKKWRQSPVGIPASRLQQLQAIAHNKDVYYVLDTVFENRWVVIRLCHTLRRAQIKCPDNHGRILKLKGQAPWFEGEGVEPAKIKKVDGEWV